MSMSVEESLAKLKQRKRVLKASLTRAENFFKDIESHSVDLDEVKVRIDKVEDTYTTLSGVCLEISFLDDALSEEIDTELEILEDKFLQLKLIAKKVLENRVESITRNEVLDQASQEAQIHVRRNIRGDSSLIRLPKIELPTFSGLYEDWFVFFDVFNSLIHSNESLNDVQKFHYLKSSLKGKAADSIASLEISGINYADAWSRLKERYDNQRLIIQTHVQAIFDLPVVRKEDGVAIRQMLDGVLKHTRALRALKRPTQHWDDLLIHVVVGKLDIASVKEWESTLESTVMPNFEELLTFLTKRCQTLEAVANRSLQDQVGTNSRKTGSNKVTAAHAAAINVKCAYCKGEHMIYLCSSFRGLSVAERFKQVKQKGLCLNCLRPKHLVKDCVSSNCKTCGKKHNSLLHMENGKDKENEEPQLNKNLESNPSSDRTNSVACHANSDSVAVSKRILLSTAVVKIKDARGRFVEGRALLDNGSQSNFVSHKFLSKLGFSGEKTQIRISGINQQVSDALKVVDLSMTSRFDSYHTNLKCIVLPCITQRLPGFELDKSDLDIPSNIRLADPEFQISKEIDILIGAEKFWDLICVGQIKIGKNRPTLQKSTLGWIVAGVIESRGREVSRSACHLSVEDRLNDSVNKFWLSEDYLGPEDKTTEDKYVEEFYKDSYIRNADGRFVVKLPIDQKVLTQLGDSEEVARKRLLSLERKFEKTSRLKEEYVKFMREYLELGHMRRAEQSKQEVKRVFLPHTAVVREESETTKTRVVFDASSKDSKGLSLNDALLKGPVIQSDLFAILIRFRCFKFVLCADIKKMYRQILIHEAHVPLQTILWRESSNEPIESYELLTVTYGTKSASFLAIKCLQQLAKLEKEKFPIASEVVLRDFYMDDLLTGSNTLQGVLEIRKQVCELLSLGGFELHKWKSNIVTQREDEGQDELLDFTKSEESKLLGILWDPGKDVLHYKSPITKIHNRISKRVMLAEVTKLFDPLGLVGPVIISAKIMIQSLWACNIGWDEAVPMHIYKNWCKIKSQLYMLEAVKIPRLTILGGDDSVIQLHGFCDASEQAYGACIYVRENYEASAALLCAKSRVAPLKTLTLPRLELCGAVLLTKLMSRVITCLNVRVYERHYWTDSKIVLAWLNSSARRWKTFVANRVSEIQRNSSPSEWHHVKSKENPADLISRGATPEQLKDSSLWWKGPHWQNLSTKPWLSEDAESLPDNMPEERNDVHLSLISVQESVISYYRYSSLKRLLRVVAYVLRFSHNAMNTVVNRKVDCITASEVANARLVVIRLIQSEMFGNDIQLLKDKKTVPTSSKLLSLNPYLDDHDVLRVGGRLENGKMSLDHKHPIILPSSHYVTKLIIKDKHVELFHAGTQTTLSAVREEFWPLAARKEVKNIVRSCVRCVKASPTPCQQIMGQLPAARITTVRPFYNTGVDYCGPFFVRDRVRRNSKQYKAYVAVFVCMVTKAVHLELVEDVTSAAFIGALKRFISRRGKVGNVYSDNGRNFQGADNELQRMLLNADFQKEVQDAITVERITWHFIPPRAPHFGGLWEAAVRSMKQHLKRTIGNAALTVGEMTTVLTQIEATLNSRPLTPLTDDPEDLSVLTPAHFLIGDSLTAYPEPDLQDVATNRLTRWQYAERLKQHFWSRWSREYLSLCQRRTKWKKEASVQLKKGQLVMLKEDETIPLKWVLARVIEVHPGMDKKIRTVTVRTNKGSYKRSIVKICPLPLEAE